MQDSLEYRIPTSLFLDVDKENYNTHLARLKNFQRVLTNQKLRLRLSHDASLQQYIENELATTDILVNIISKVTCHSEPIISMSDVLRKVGISNSKFVRALFNNDHFSPKEIDDLRSKIT